MSSLRQQLQGLTERTVANNRWRQRQCFNLIPSEQTPSTLVRLFEIADPCGRYAEHGRRAERDVYYYQGIDFIRDVERECQKALADYLGCQDIELRPISGQMANEVVWKALVRFFKRQRGQPDARLERILHHDLRQGGHLSAQPRGGLFHYAAEGAPTPMPLLADDRYRVDTAKLLDQVESLRPELIIFGKSLFLYPEPVQEVCDLVADWDDRPVVLYDMAHVLGLYGAFQDPLAAGADLVTASTHKTFFGPQRGVVAGNLAESDRYPGLWHDIENRAFPGSTSNHHLGTLLALLAATYEMVAFRDQYQQQVLSNAKAFAAALNAAGIGVEGDRSYGHTETHQVVCRVKQHGNGEEVAARLERNHIIVNYQALPDDESFAHTNGIRLGVAEMTRFGMTEEDFSTLADLMAAIIVEERDMSREVAIYRQRFLSMEYCLPPQESAELGARLLGSVLPGSDSVGRFADRLLRLSQAAR